MSYAIFLLNNKTELKVKQGTGITVFYNSQILYFYIQLNSLTANNNEELTQIVLPNGVIPNSDSFIMCELLSSGWRPSGIVASLNFSTSGSSPTIRFSVDSVSNSVLIGTFIMSRNRFNIN